MPESNVFIEAALIILSSPSLSSSSSPVASSKPVPIPSGPSSPQLGRTESSPGMRRTSSAAGAGFASSPHLSSFPSLTSCQKPWQDTETPWLSPYPPGRQKVRHAPAFLVLTLFQENLPGRLGQERQVRPVLRAVRPVLGGQGLEPAPAVQVLQRGRHLLTVRATSSFLPSRLIPASVQTSSPQLAAIHAQKIATEFLGVLGVRFLFPLPSFLVSFLPQGSFNCLAALDCAKEIESVTRQISAQWTPPVLFDSLIGLISARLEDELYSWFKSE